MSAYDLPLFYLPLRVTHAEERKIEEGEMEGEKERGGRQEVGEREKVRCLFFCISVPVNLSLFLC